MFGTLEAAIEELNSPLDGTELARLIALADRLAARISAAAGDDDHTRGWEADGATSMMGPG
jgi:hypothetical protein